MVAASDSSEEIKASADYVCIGENDHETIQTAINSIAETGGTISLTEGTFYLATDTYITGNNIIFEGAGEDKTLLVWSAGRFGTIGKEYVTLRNFKTTGTGAIVLWNSSHIKVENVTATVDDSFAGAAFTTFVSSKIIEDIEYNNCKAIDCGRHGWMSDGWEAPKLIKNIRYVNCKAINCGKDSRFSPHGQWTCGFQLGENSDIDGCEVINCYAEGNWEAGFIVEGAPTIKNMVIRDCVSKNNGIKPDDYYNGPDEEMYGCLFGAGFWLNDDITLYNCVSENNRKCGYSVWMKPSSLTTKLYDCVDTGSEIGFKLDYTENVYLENCTSIDAGKYGIYAASANDLTTVGLEIINPGGDGEKCNVFGIKDYPVTNCSFDLDIYGGHGTVIPCLNGQDITFTGTVRSDNENPVVVSGTNVDITGLNVTSYDDEEEYSFEIKDASINKETGISVHASVKSCTNEGGNAVVIFKLMDGDTVIGLYSGELYIKDVATFRVRFHGYEPYPGEQYKVKIYVWDELDSSVENIGIDLAKPVEIQ
ncbi:MAG: right-handed parallel beta-helix repeat-containing protein [Atribacterota bacterium]|nr:right-handed parallel beta-helix repeat-containing protein [Atribacterota bacterium]